MCYSSIESGISNFELMCRICTLSVQNFDYFEKKKNRNNKEFLYSSIRTNLPHQVMEFPDHHYPEDTPAFASQSDVLNYLHSYANKFDLKKHIKFSHLVVQVVPVEDEKWEVVVKNLPTNTYETNVFDAVFICNGHYSAPSMPQMTGADEFRGKLIHSHDFRTAERYRGRSSKCLLFLFKNQCCFWSRW